MAMGRIEYTLLDEEKASSPTDLERFAAQVIHWHHAPMNPYSEDLRKKIIEALRRGTTKSEAARSFGVSRSSVKRYAKLAEQGRPLTPKKRPGSKRSMAAGERDEFLRATWRVIVAERIDARRLVFVDEAAPIPRFIPSTPTHPKGSGRVVRCRATGVRTLRCFRA